MSKDLFLMMREQEVITNNFLPTKKELLTSGKDFAKKLLEAGEIDKHELYSQVLRLKTSLEAIESEVKSSLENENFEAFGIKGTFKNGYDKPNFEDDDLYSKLKREIKEREELLKLALKSEKPIYDSDGIEVPKVSTTPTKSSLTINF